MMDIHGQPFTWWQVHAHVACLDRRVGQSIRCQELGKFAFPGAGDVLLPSCDLGVGLIFGTFHPYFTLFGEDGSPFLTSIFFKDLCWIFASRKFC